MQSTRKLLPPPRNVGGTLITLTCTVRGPYEVAAMLEGLQRASAWNLRRLLLPPLYESGVRYEREPLGQERWQLPEETYQRGYGDCEDLAAWRAAELVVTGKDQGARAVVKSIRRGLMHCIVLRGDGSEECPSRLLGMRGKG